MSLNLDEFKKRISNEHNEKLGELLLDVCLSEERLKVLEALTSLITTAFEYGWDEGLKLGHELGFQQGVLRGQQEYEEDERC